MLAFIHQIFTEGLLCARDVKCHGIALWREMLGNESFQEPHLAMMTAILKFPRSN